MGTANNGHRICPLGGIKCRQAHRKKGKQMKQKSFEPSNPSFTIQTHKCYGPGWHGSNSHLYNIPKQMAVDGGM